jgi:hypothetical protein
MRRGRETREAARALPRGGSVDRVLDVVAGDGADGAAHGRAGKPADHGAAERAGRGLRLGRGPAGAEHEEPGDEAGDGRNAHTVTPLVAPEAASGASRRPVPPVANAEGTDSAPTGHERRISAASRIVERLGKACPRPGGIDAEPGLVARRVEGVVGGHDLAAEQPGEAAGVEVAALEGLLAELLPEGAEEGGVGLAVGRAAVGVALAGLSGVAPALFARRMVNW